MRIRRMGKTVNLIKLSVGTDDVAGLDAWQNTKRAQTADGYPRHVTRMWPKREKELLNGGSIFWVIKGVILCRQPILRLDAYDSADGIRRCAIVSKPGLIRVTATPKRAFQGWRYLKPEDTPPDLACLGTAKDLPPHIRTKLVELGIW